MHFTFLITSRYCDILKVLFESLNVQILVQLLVILNTILIFLIIPGADPGGLVAKGASAYPELQIL